MAKATIIRRIPPVPIAIAVGLVNLVIGLILGIINALNALRINKLIDVIATYAGVSATNILPLKYPSAAILIVAYPISGFIIGFLGTLIVAAVYNWVAKKNPIKLELK